MALNPQRLCRQFDKKNYPLVKWTAKHVFFTVVAIKIAVSMNWCTIPVYLY